MQISCSFWRLWSGGTLISKCFVNDIEHGFFHSLCVCYIYYILNENINEQAIASALLHDFLKCNGYSQEEHDKELKEYFTNLLNETYTHSNPPNDNLQLIISDRIELRRYDDYKEWVDNRYYNMFNKLDDNKKYVIDSFYSNSRPILEYFYKNRNKIFIRHGIEDVNLVNTQLKFPPDNSYLEVDDMKSYPIEVDSVPFGYRDCMGSDANKQYGYCSNHGGLNHWNKVKGFILFNDFIKNNGKIINTNERDHLYANSNINIKEWKFLYQNTNDNDEQIKLLKESNIPIISQDIILKLFTLKKLFYTRLIVLNKYN